MPRDPRKLTTFRQADALVLRVYPFSGTLPTDERFGLQAQVRRAAVSVVANLIEGCQRSGRRDYMRFVELAFGSAAEVAYLVGLARRLGYVDLDEASHLEAEYVQVVRGLERLRQVIARAHDDR